MPIASRVRLMNPSIKISRKRIYLHTKINLRNNFVLPKILKKSLSIIVNTSSQIIVYIFFKLTESDIASEVP